MFNTTPSNRSFALISLITLSALFLINLPQLNFTSTTIKSTVRLVSVREEVPTSPTSSPTQDEELYLLPPSQEWMQAQMEIAMEMLSLKQDPPNNWKGCDHLPQTYYFPNIQTVFTGIPKSGCSNWLEALLRAEGTLDYQLPGTEVDQVHGRLSARHRMSYIRELGEDISDNFSFTVIRNPWTRMVSGYRDKLSNETTQGNNKRSIGIAIVREMRGISDPDLLETLYPTFEEFLRYLIKHQTTRNVHFMPQHNILCIPQSKYDYIVPLEYSSVLNEDIWRHINASVSLLGSYDSVSDPREQTSAQRAREWFSKIDPNIVEQIYELYKEDFALLSYSNFTDPNFPLPLYNQNS